MAYRRFDILAGGGGKDLMGAKTIALCLNILFVLSWSWRSLQLLKKVCFCRRVPGSVHDAGIVLYGTEFPPSHISFICLSLQIF